MFLFRLALGAVLIRFLFILATHSFDTAFINYVNSSDALYYEYMGRQIADAWRDGTTFAVPTGNYGYFYWNGLIYYLAGYKPDLIRILNSITSVCIGLNLYFISLKLSGAKAARISFALAAFFPSAILWSSLNLKDSLIIFLITLIVRKNIELMEKFQLGKVLFMSLLLMALISLRFYIGILLAICISLSYILTATKFHWWQRIAYTLAIFLIAGLALQQMGYGFMGKDYVFSQSIETIGEQHEKGAYGQGAFAGDVSFDSYSEALKYLPIGIFYFLFGPLPWQSVGPIRIITLPEMIFLYYLYNYFRVGIKNLWQTQRGACLFLLVLIICFGLIYSLGSSNIGGLYRVRLQVIMIAFIAISEGMQNSWVLARIFGRLTGKKYLLK
ncbi:hypothetical protein L7E55_05550 [Pelotomaculum isophthalicicum JI]|uniref:Glycosyltransferase RgtA/B/C/D-like domain-containing protein n=1 Tax=Pelotomaculum isophthalicicum JI TaxID=947010 RepID=A0A9X4JVQ7_9FIRM|nr:hypothetical protein [Pelotomaculum isophthalicicum]MDF9407828.1 hypothetical protein [Pelotomaculum isophthalicicum JI]